MRVIVLHPVATPSVVCVMTAMAPVDWTGDARPVSYRSMAPVEARVLGGEKSSMLALAAIAPRFGLEVGA